MAKKGMATGVEVARISVKVSPDTTNFRRDLKKKLEAIEQSVRAVIDVVPDMKDFRRDVVAQTKGMRTSVKVDADVDRGFINRITEKLRNIKGPDFGSGINGMGGAAIAAGGLALAAPLMGLITSALLTLPGLLAAVATPVAAITLGLDGIKKAAERLKEPFEGLRATMNAVNESAFGPVFEKLGAVFPTLERSLPTVSQGLADMAESIADVVTSPAGMERIQATIRNIGTALSQSAPGIGSFTNGLLTLAEQFSQKMPDLSEWFNGAGKSFEQWIAKITRKDWFTGESLLDKAFGGLGGTLRTILDTLGGIASAGMEFFKDPAKINDFNNALKGVGDSLTRITELSSSLNNGNLFSSVMPTGLKLDGGFDLQSVIDDITKPFTSENAPWRDMWAGLQEGASSAWSSVTATVSSAVASIGGSVSSIGSTLSEIWTGISSAAVAAFQSMVSSASSAVTSIVAYVAALPGQIAAALSELATEGMAAGRALVEGMVNGIGSMINQAVAKAKELASQVAGAVTGFLGINSPSKLFTEYGAWTAEGFADGIRSQVSAVKDAAKTMADAANAEMQGSLDYGDSPSIEAAQRLMQVPTDFAAATGKQFMSDLGITGDGLLSRLATEGTQYIFQVASVDEAFSAKDRAESKQALAVAGRR